MAFTTHYPKHLPHGLHLQPGLPTGLQPHQAIVQEVFSSIQGEGCWVGHRQLFIRLAHCHLACAYCDTPMTTPSGLAYVETAAGAESWHTYDNPMTAEALWAACLPLLQQAPHHSLSLTGGEPLLYPEFAANLFALARQAGLKTYLETSGTQPNRLEAVLPVSDLVAMDIKLASATGQPTPWGLHQAFAQQVLQAANSTLNFKVVVAPNTPLQELDQLIEPLAAGTEWEWAAAFRRRRPVISLSKPPKPLL
jgi:7-carboxy-7-deazaguanine synthase